MINFARSFIYTTALPEAAVRVILAAYRVFPRLTKERQTLHGLIDRFQRSTIPFRKLNSDTPIQGVIIPGNELVVKAAESLHRLNIDVRAIRYPTVPKGEERLRVNLHAFNSESDVDKLTEGLTRVKS